MINDPLTPCPPGYHRLYPGIELCADCGALVTDAAPLRFLTPREAQAMARTIIHQAKAALLRLHVARPTQARVRAVQVSTTTLVTQLEALALNGDGASSRLAFRAAHIWLRTTATRWVKSDAEGRTQGVTWAVKALRDSVQHARRWEQAAELDHARTTLRRRAAGAEDRL